MQCHLSLTHELNKDYVQEVNRKSNKNIDIACDTCGKELAHGSNLKRHPVTNHASDEEKNLARKYVYAYHVQKDFIPKKNLLLMLMFIQRVKTSGVITALYISKLHIV